jgi:hypothetical protein
MTSAVAETADGEDVVSIDVEDGWIDILQDIIRRSVTLTFLAVETAHTCSKMPASCYELMRDTAAAHYMRETGRSWVPAIGNRISLGVTSAIIDGRAFLRARRDRVREANTAEGTPVVFTGGRLTFSTDGDMKIFGDNLLRTLNAVRERVGDMYLVHGGDMRGLDRLAASWAEQHGIQQVRSGLDRKLGDRAGFRRNEQMLSLRPRFVIAFQGNGVTERLVIDAKKTGIRVVDRRGPLGTPPAQAG